MEFEILRNLKDIEFFYQLSSGANGILSQVVPMGSLAEKQADKRKSEIKVGFWI